MSTPRSRLPALVAVLMGGALIGGHVSPANAQFSSLPLSLGLGPSTVGVGVGPAQPSPVLGQVSFLLSNNLALTEPPSPLVVYKQPSGCFPTPAAQGDRLAHNIYNETNVDVQAYLDGNCTIPAPVRIRPNQGSHFDYVLNSFKAVAPVDANIAVAGQNVGVNAAPSTAVVPPVALYVSEGQPMVNFDPAPQGCQVITYIVPALVPHSMLNNGTGTLRLFDAAACQGPVTEVAAGHVAHLTTYQSWNYAPAGTVARASTRTKSVCARATSRKRSTRTTKRSTRTTKRSTRAASTCKTAKKKAAKKKAAAHH